MIKQYSTWGGLTTLAIQIESGIRNTSMLRPHYEIHHSRDNYDDYRPFPIDMAPVALHHHNFYEVFFFLSGAIHYHIESRIYDLKPGDVLLISPFEMHRPVFLPASAYYERIVLWLDEETIRNLVNDSDTLSFLSCFNQEGMSQSNLVRLSSAKQNILLSYMDQLVESTQAPGFYAKKTEPALLTLILSLLNETTQNCNMVYQQPVQLSLPVRTTLNYINEHLGEDLSLKFLSSLCYLSPQHLLRTFHEAMGLPVHEYIRQKRLMTAKQHIQNGLSATEAATRCGFHDYSAFYRAFKKEYDLAPSQVKNSF